MMAVVERFYLTPALEVCARTTKDSKIKVVFIDIKLTSYNSGNYREINFTNKRGNKFSGLVEVCQFQGQRTNPWIL